MEPLASLVFGSRETTYPFFLALDNIKPFDNAYPDRFSKKKQSSHKDGENFVHNHSSFFLTFL